jgi:hypothetical protein
MDETFRAQWNAVLEHFEESASFNSIRVELDLNSNWPRAFWHSGCSAHVPVNPCPLGKIWGRWTCAIQVESLCWRNGHDDAGRPGLGGSYQGPSQGSGLDPKAPGGHVEGPPDDGCCLGTRETRAGLEDAASNPGGPGRGLGPPQPPGGIQGGLKNETAQPRLSKGWADLEDGPEAKSFPSATPNLRHFHVVWRWGSWLRGKQTISRSFELFPVTVRNRTKRSQERALPEYVRPGWRPSPELEQARLILAEGYPLSAHWLALLRQEAA